jgi:hypothetical protein
MIALPQNKLLIICAFVLQLCGCGDPTPMPEFDNSPYGIVSIAHLKTMAGSEPRTITEDISIEGYVVANDLYGEYYKSIVICDDSGGIEISVDARQTAKIFPYAAKVNIHCTSLSIGSYDGRIVLGAKSNEYGIGRIEERDFARFISIDKLSPKATEPTEITIDAISAKDIGNYVEINDVSFSNADGLKWCDTDPTTGEAKTTTRQLIDQKGNTIFVRTIAQCSYAAELVPSGRGKIRSIVEKQNSRYSLRIVNRQFDFRE